MHSMKHHANVLNILNNTNTSYIFCLPLPLTSALANSCFPTLAYVIIYWESFIKLISDFLNISKNMQIHFVKCISVDYKADRHRNVVAISVLFTRQLWTWASLAVCASELKHLWLCVPLNLNLIGCVCLWT